MPISSVEGTAMRHCLFHLFVAILLYQPSSHAQCVDLQAADILIGEFCSPHLTYDSMGFKAVATQLDRLYLFQLNVGLVIVDIIDPAGPSYMSSLPVGSGSSGFRSGMELWGDLVYLAADSLIIVSVTDPFVPNTVAVVSTRSQSLDLARCGSTLLVANGYEGLSSYDISNPITPALKDSLLTPGTMTMVGCFEGLVFAATEWPHVVHLVDVSEKSDLLLVGSTPLPGTIHDMYYTDGYLLTTTSVGAVLWQVSPTGIITMIREFPEGRGTAYLNNGVAWMAGESSWYGRLLRYDVASGVPDGELLTETWFRGTPWRIAEQDGVVWMAELGDWWSGSERPCCQALSPTVSVPPDPIGTYSWPSGTGSWSGREVLARVDDLLFNAGSYFVLQAADVSDLSQIQPAGSWNMPHLAEVLGAIDDVIVTHHEDVFGSERDWLEFWRVRHESEVELDKLGEADLLRFATFGGLDNGVLSFSHDDGILLVDAADPTLPIVHGPFVEWADVAKLSLSGNTLLIIHDEVAKLLDIGNPAAPTQIGQWAYGPDYASSCALEGGVGAIAMRDGQSNYYVQVLDCATSGDPQLSSTFATGGYDIFLHQGLLVDVGVLRTQIFDLAYPTAPLDLGPYPGRLYRTRRDGRWILGLDSLNSGMLTVYNPPCGAVSAVPLFDETPLPQVPSIALSLAPNPANPRTTVHYQLPVGGSGTLCVFDQRGRLIRRLKSGYMGPGVHVVAWDGRDDEGKSVASGLYLVRLRMENQAANGKLMLVR